MKFFLILSLFLVSISAFSQPKIDIISETKGLSIRGLSVVDNQIFWVSGTNGTVGKSIDGGATIEWFTVKGFEKSDFRDIEAFDKNTATILSIGEPAYLLKTLNGGKNWKIVYENHKKRMFLDAMSFYHNQKGIVIGDAIEGKIFLAVSNDSGSSWTEKLDSPIAKGQEGCFASSGTNILIRKNDYYFVTGGKNSRFFKNEKASEIPIIQGKESTGANSIAISKNGKNIIIVGGDFNQKNESLDNCLISKNGGKSFSKSVKNPTGYRSCVEFINRKTAISCGLNGVDISFD
ncbi:MAG: oxidoreductase, partial [Bacteroidota bacterium]